MYTWCVIVRRDSGRGFAGKNQGWSDARDMFPCLIAFGWEKGRDSGYWGGVVFSEVESSS